MDQLRTKPWAAATAAGLFFAVAAEEAARVLLRLPWAGFSELASGTVGGALCGLWLGGAISMLAMLASSDARRYAWVFSLLGIVGMIAHGAIVTWGGMSVSAGRWGLIIAALAVAQIVLVRRAFRRGLLSTRAPSAPAARGQVSSYSRIRP